MKPNMPESTARRFTTDTPDDSSLSLPDDYHEHFGLFSNDEWLEHLPAFFIRRYRVSVPNSSHVLERSKRLGFHELDPFRDHAESASILVKPSTKAAGRGHHFLVGKIGGVVGSKIEVMFLETASSLVVADEEGIPVGPQEARRFLPLWLLEGAP
jgi:hypothetical protein